MDEAREIASRLGLVDVFVLRRVSDDQLVNLVGVGRGERWAGSISIDPDREPLVAGAQTLAKLVRHSGESVRIFGPYWAEEAFILGVGDFIVVGGGPGLSGHDDESLIEAAGDLAWSVGEVPTEKRLADELELTTAALSVASLPSRRLDEFLENLAEATASALSCEFGAVVIRRPEHRLLLAPSGWQPAASEEVVREALLQLLPGLDFDMPMVAQDLRNDPTGRSPLGFEEGLVSRCVIPLHVGALSGAIVVAHMIDTPRGFTSLCQRVAASIGEQASRVLDTSFGDDLGVTVSIAGGPLQ
ncbi:MAG: hypothetical protein GY724_24105 [Actinomycetia bacterium]|nr:hypothetical protein [Actinomycetes bacterium]MCP4225838.1 hypothetical protein [Actinomycetes bacterium]MCP5035762.1 hypothetical protein [Actinomycetes bacterium]